MPKGAHIINAIPAMTPQILRLLSWAFAKPTYRHDAFEGALSRLVWKFRSEFNKLWFFIACKILSTEFAKRNLSQCLIALDHKEFDGFPCRTVRNANGRTL